MDILTFSDPSRVWRSEPTLTTDFLDGEAPDNGFSGGITQLNEFLTGTCQYFLI